MEYRHKQVFSQSFDPSAPGDVTAASCKQSGSNYIITINIKNGNSYATKGTATCNAPLDKSGICVGDKDKGYYDHKRAQLHL